jgi:formylglycine-generating enzyme required for sulfatase activity
MTEPHSADIRQYLTTAYGDEDLTTFCFDYFRDVYDNFTTGMTKGQKIQLLLDRCQRREAIPDLLVALERDRSEQYRKRFGAPAVEARPVSPQPARDPRQVFISHTHEDTDFAHRLAADLQKNGWRVWLAPDSIRPGEKWVEAIERGLEESSVFAVLLTPAAVKSRWVKTETNLAIEMEHQDILRFIPVEIEICSLPLVWRAYQRIPLAGEYGDGLAVLLAALRGQTEDDTPPSAIPTPTVETGGKDSEQPAAPAHPSVAGERRVAAPPPRLQVISDSDAQKQLRARLTAANPATRAETARDLGRLRVADAETITALLRLYPTDPADAPRHAALEALLALGRHADVGMVWVPAGEFLMGSADDDREAESDEKPQHRIYLPAYALDRTPVTNAQYRRFIEAGGYANSAYWKEATAAGRWKDSAYIDYDNKPRAQPYYWGDAKLNSDQQPVVGVSWYEALAYLRWAGKRLPTEAEWEKAATWEVVDKETGRQGNKETGKQEPALSQSKGDKGRKRRYPWGDEWDPKKCNTEESRIKKTTPVGNYSPAGDSPCGAADMAGNVFEWCSSANRNYPYDPDDGREDLGGGDTVIRVLRGGSWYTDRKWARGAYRHWGNPWGRDINWGFRGCCSTSSPSGGSGS